MGKTCPVGELAIKFGIKVVSLTMPHVTTRVLTKSCAQYDRPTGFVASSIVPTQNAVIDTSMIKPG